MQQFSRILNTVFPRIGFLQVLILTPFTIAAGCIDRPTTIDAPVERPFTGTTITLAVSDPSDRDLARQLARSWSHRSGATVVITETPFDGTADIGIISTADMPRWAESGALAAAPSHLSTSGDAYRWEDLFPIVSSRLLVWNNEIHALPITGEGLVLAYRKDVIQSPDVPRTWDELLEMAMLQGKNSLPPPPTSAELRNAEFMTAAAGYDRRALNRLSPGQNIKDEFFAFDFDAGTGEPRLLSAGFRYAASLFKKLADFRCLPADCPTAAAAFTSGKAKLGIISLKELAQVGAAIGEKIGIAPLPGTRFTFDAEGKRIDMEQGTRNRTLYVGWGGLVGVVSAKSANVAPAWDFLVDASLPDRTALDLISISRWGAGPYRSSHLDVRMRVRWMAYELPEAETERLTDALGTNIGAGTVNPCIRLRTPNQADFAFALDAGLREIMSPKGRPSDDSLQAVTARWKTIAGKLPPAEWRAMLRRSLGI